MNKIKQSKLAILLLITNCIAYASTVTIPNTFIANTPAVAADVNENFSAVKTSVDDNDNDIATLLAAVSQLQADLTAANLNILSLTSQLSSQNIRISNIESNTVLELDGFLSHEVKDGYDSAIFSSVNLHVLNGDGNLAPVNGVGNVIIGYNSSTTTFNNFCSDPSYNNQVNCESNGAIWGSNQRLGSHNLIMGGGNSYTSKGSIVTGVANISSRKYASVIGGHFSVASGSYSFVVGENNIATGYGASVTGGKFNTASSQHSSVSGGENNSATNSYSSVSGGFENTASGGYSSVSGGDNNSAGGNYSSVSGGSSRGANGQFDWRAGSLFSDF